MKEKGASWVSDPYGWDGQHPFADQVHEAEHPTESQLLGPDGRPLQYRKFKMGFDLSSRNTRE